MKAKTLYISFCYSMKEYTTSLKKAQEAQANNKKEIANMWIKC